MSVHIYDNFANYAGITPSGAFVIDGYQYSGPFDEGIIPGLIQQQRIDDAGILWALEADPYPGFAGTFPFSSSDRWIVWVEITVQVIVQIFIYSFINHSVRFKPGGSCSFVVLTAASPQKLLTLEGHYAILFLFYS